MAAIISRHGRHNYRRRHGRRQGRRVLRGRRAFATATVATVRILMPRNISLAVSRRESFSQGGRRHGWRLFTDAPIFIFIHFQGRRYALLAAVILRAPRSFICWPASLSPQAAAAFSSMPRRIFLRETGDDARCRGRKARRLTFSQLDDSEAPGDAARFAASRMLMLERPTHIRRRHFDSRHATA